MSVTAFIFFKKMSKSLMYRAIITPEFSFRKMKLSSESLIKLMLSRVTQKVLFQTYSDCFRSYKLLTRQQAIFLNLK